MYTYSYSTLWYWWKVDNHGAIKHICCSWGNSKFRLVYEPIEHDFELSSFWITAPNHFRALIILWLKIQTDFERYLKSDDRSSKISSCHHFRSPLQIIFELWSLTKDPNWFRAIPQKWWQIGTHSERYSKIMHRSEQMAANYK